MGCTSRDGLSDEEGCPGLAVHAPWLDNAPLVSGCRFMSATWVVLLLILFQNSAVPVVRADDVPFHLGMVPSSFAPSETSDAGLREWIVSTPFDWYAELSMVYFDRTIHEATFGQHLGPVQMSGAGNSFFDISQQDNRFITTNDLNMEPKAGLRFLVGRTIWADPCDDRCCVSKPGEMPDHLRSLSIELGYLGLLQQQQATARYAAQPGSAIVSRFINTGVSDSYNPVVWPFDYANLNTLTYRSRFDSAELNLRYATSAGRRMPVDVLAGVRYMKLQENLDYMAANTGSPLPGLGGAAPYGMYSTRTENDLIGLQIGGDLHYRLTSGWSLMGRGRGGLMVNSASQRSNISGTMIASAMPLNENSGASGVGFASLFEFGIHTNYQLTSNLSFMVGYQGLFLSDLSTASRQYMWNSDLSNRQLDRNGSLFFFGPAAGIEWRW